MDKKKSKKEHKMNKGALIGAVAIAAVVLVLATVAAVLNVEPAISEDYFVSDENKLVLSLDDEMAAFIEGEYEPDYTRIVYYYNGGEEISGARIYFEYEDEDAAREADENISMDDVQWAVSRRVNGKYIILQVRSTEYEGLTTEEVRQTIEDMKNAGVAS